LYWLAKFLWRFNDKFWQYSFIFLQIIVTMIHHYLWEYFEMIAPFNTHITHLSFVQRSGLWYSFMGRKNSALFNPIIFENDLISYQLCWIYSLPFSHSRTVCGATIYKRYKPSNS
jgi:hypothetical protein